MFYCKFLTLKFSGKPIGFYYKNWVLAIDGGHPFRVIPYLGKAMCSDQGSLGLRVVNSLLEIVKKPTCHEVFFDNFFTYVSLLQRMRVEGIKTTD